LASPPPPSAPLGSLACLAWGGSAPLPGTVFDADPDADPGDDHLPLASRPLSSLANFGVRASISRGFFTGPRASAQLRRRDGLSLAHSHESVDGDFHAEKFFQVKHMDDDYNRLRTPSAFFRLSPSSSRMH
jgi:hypothetical protein